MAFCCQFRAPAIYHQPNDPFRLELLIASYPVDVTVAMFPGRLTAVLKVGFGAGFRAGF
jgi:hypothetical protein